MYIWSYDGKAGFQMKPSNRKSDPYNKFTKLHHDFQNDLAKTNKNS